MTLEQARAELHACGLTTTLWEVAGVVKLIGYRADSSAAVSNAEQYSVRYDGTWWYAEMSSQPRIVISKDIALENVIRALCLFLTTPIETDDAASITLEVAQHRLQMAGLSVTLSGQNLWGKLAISDHESRTFAIIPHRERWLIVFEDHLETVLLWHTPSLGKAIEVALEKLHAYAR